MIAVVLTTATENEEKTAKELSDLGYRKQEVWVKWSFQTQKEDEERTLRKVGVAQFMVGDFWGRGPD